MNIFEKVKDLEQSVIRLHKEFAEIPYYSPWEYNLNPKYELIWRFKKVYYNNITDLFKTINPDVDKRTFTRYISEEANLPKALAMGIQPVFAAKISDRSYITTDGVPLSIASLTALAYNPTQNLFNTTTNGEHITLNRAVLVMENFLYNGRVGKEEVFFLDNDWTNCRINNLTFKDRKRDE